MNFADLLKAKGIAPQDVLLFRHRPKEPELNRVLPWLASKEPTVFNAYQQTQVERVEAAMKKATFVGSFIGVNPREALFVGLYRVGKSWPLSERDYAKIAAYKRLKEFGIAGFTATEDRPSILWFDLKLTDFYSGWKGKLIVGWPPPERSWWRRADRNAYPVLAIHAENALIPQMPSWDRLIVSYNELKTLPAAWKARLSDWHAIYLIFDRSDGKSYVGSAYGRNSVFGRWMSYATKGHGGNRLLKGRDPKNFQFSILQWLPRDIDVHEVVRIESTRKERLHTRRPYGLNNN